MSEEKLKEVEIITQRRDEAHSSQAQNEEIKNENKKQESQPQQIASKKNGLDLENKTEQNNHPKITVQQENPENQQNPQEEQQLDIFNVEEKKVIKYPTVLAFLENNYFQTIITLLTIYALFGGDVKILATDNSADLGFDVLSIICLIMFSIEIILAVIAKDDYLWSFFFWLDVVSTVSLILDITMISSQMFGTSSAGGSQSKQLAKAGQASRVGTKAGRVVRIVRLIRIVKLYKAASEGESSDKLESMLKNRRNKKIHPKKSMINDSSQLDPIPEVDEHNQEQSPHDNQINSQLINNGQHRPSVSQPGGSSVAAKKEPVAKPIVDKESRVSKKLSDLTTKRVIVIVLLLLFIMPLFSADYFFDPPQSIDYAMKHLQTISETPCTVANIIKTVETIIIQHNKINVITPLVYLSTPFTFIQTFNDSIYSLLRSDEQDTGSYDLNKTLFVANHQAQPEFATIIKDVAYLTDSNITFTAVLNKRTPQVVDAGLSIGRTLFVCVVLTMAAIMFTQDANEIALGPIERMIEKVNQIARNPISAKEQKLVKDGEDSEQYETVIIENAIVKIGSLLALGFGEAGSEIIGSNMSRGGDVDPMIPGKKKCAIYGFCDIRNFTDATEQLQEDVMLFVNNIGDVVHSMVDRFAGAANKNIGDAFLLVWKINEKKYSLEADNSMKFKDKTYIQTLADFSIVSFMKIWAKLNREKKCLDYRKEERLLKRMPGYRVKMGFGLHIGWGIEGAIGSHFKIDVSYLSPNVNVAANLEAGTKAFGVPLLISSELQELFTDKMKVYTRYIDRVMMGGYSKPIGLYSIDMAVEKIPPSKDPEEYAQQGLSKQDRYEIEKLKKMDMLAMLENPEENPWDADLYIKTNKDCKLMMDDWNEKFQNIFSEGFQCYLKGEWQEAKEKLLQGEKIIPDDGPTKNLMHVMEQHHFQAPKDWPGYREFDGH